MNNEIIMEHIEFRMNDFESMVEHLENLHWSIMGNIDEDAGLAPEVSCHIIMALNSIETAKQQLTLALYEQRKASI